MHFIVPDICNRNGCFIVVTLQWSKYSANPNGSTLYTEKSQTFTNDWNPFLSFVFHNVCELWVERVGTFGEVLYRNQWPVNFNLHFGELHSDNSINDKKKIVWNYIPKCYKVKRILISFNCFSEYIYIYINYSQWSWKHVFLHIYLLYS